MSGALLIAGDRTIAPARPHVGSGFRQCPWCDGYGVAGPGDDLDDDCDVCEGTGRVKIEVPMKPLLLEFHSLRDVMDHCAQIHPEQCEPWRYREYLRAGVLGRKELSKLFDKMTAADLAAIRWADIAEEVADLSTLPRNPE